MAFGRWSPKIFLPAQSDLGCCHKLCDIRLPTFFSAASGYYATFSPSQFIFSKQCIHPIRVYIKKLCAFCSLRTCTPKCYCTQACSHLPHPNIRCETKPGSHQTSHFKIGQIFLDGSFFEETRQMTFLEKFQDFP